MREARRSARYVGSTSGFTGSWMFKRSVSRVISPKGAPAGIDAVVSADGGSLLISNPSLLAEIEEEAPRAARCAGAGLAVK